MPDFAVVTTFSGKDRVTQAFKRMGKSADNFSSTTTSAFRRASREGSQFKSVMKGILAAGAVQRGLGMLNQGISSVVTQFIELDDATTAATVRFKDIGPDAKNFAAQLKIIKDAAREAGATTEFTGAQSASALDFMARAGFKSTTAMGSLRSMIDLATASGEEFSRAADISSDLLGSFGLNVDNVGQKIKNLNRLNDVLVYTANSANVTLEDMFETMRIGGPIGLLAGISLEEISAATAFLGGAGIKGSNAATALKNSILNLTAQTPAAMKALESIGVTVDDGSGGMKKFSSILAEMGSKLKGLGKIKQAVVLNAILGKKAIAGGINLIKGVEAVDLFEKALLGAGGTSQKTANIIRQSLGNRIKSLTSATIELGFKFLSAFDKDGKDAITRMTIAMRGFDMTPIINTAKLLGNVMVILLATIKPFIPILPVIVGGWLAYNAALKAQMALGWIRFGIKLYQTLQLMTIAQQALNFTMMANPIGLVIAGVTLLIAAGVLLVKNWDTVKSSFISVFGFIKKTFLSFVHVYVTIWSTVFKFILSSIAKVGKLIGIDVSGIEGMIDKVNELQKSTQQGTFYETGDGATTKESFSKKGAVTAPNKAEVEARQRIGFNGRLEIAGAPKDSTFTSHTSGAPPIQVDMLGANP